MVRYRRLVAAFRGLLLHLGLPLRLRKLFAMGQWVELLRLLDLGGRVGPRWGMRCLDLDVLL